MTNSVEHIVVTEQGAVVVDTGGPQVVLTGIMGPPGASSITDMQDLDKTELTDGATLVYKANTATWRTTNKLDNQILEAGQF